MLSTGNDIVSLVADDMQRAIRPVFYQKILSATEITLYQQYQNAIPFANYVWLLWSAKEAAFKYLQRSHPALVFSPTRFVIDSLGVPAQTIAESVGPLPVERVGFDNDVSWAVRVTQYAETIQVRSILYSNAVHSVANGHNNFDDVYWGIKIIENMQPDHQSSEVRKFLLRRLQGIFGDKIFLVSKNGNGAPLLSNEETKMLMPVSFSHHHEFVAYSFILR